MSAGEALLAGLEAGFRSADRTMDILYLSHCVPNAPDKGEKIRAFYILEDLCRQFRVHLACFARTEAEVAAARAMSQCASVYVEKISPKWNLLQAGWGFLWGDSINLRYFASGRMRSHIHELTRSQRLSATITFSTAMAPYAPPDIPMLLDMVDVDSEKWLQYARMRKPSWLFATEAKRLRSAEIHYARTARRTILVTNQECELLKSFAPGANAGFIENGIDVARFDPAPVRPQPTLEGRKFLAFVGAMDYYPNVDGAVWFADEVFNELRKRIPDLELGIVGKDPAPAVAALAARPGIWVEASPPDVRPFLAASAAVVTPLRLARGIQNKVLEGLAMGKSVFASTPVCTTLGADLPRGVFHCRDAQEFIDRISRTPLIPAAYDSEIRAAAKVRFSWSHALELLRNEVAGVAQLETSAGASAARERTI